MPPLVPLKSSLRLSRSQAILIVCLSAIFVYYSRQPLHHTDLWGHLAYGRWIADHGRLPATEPFMPLARGVPLIDTAWLAQLVSFAIHSLAGLAGLQVLHGLAIAVSCGLLGWSVARRTRSICAASFALVVFLLLERFQFRIIRPQTAGLVCLIALVSLVSVRAARRPAAWGVPLLLAGWANLHGSFVTGLGWLAICAGGRALEVAQRTRSWRPTSRDRRLRWLIRVGLCATVAACVNPYGPRLHLEVLTFAQNPNLHDLIEWKPLRFGTWQGRGCVATALLIVVARLAAGRGTSAEIWLPVAVFGGATLWSARMLVWWSPLAAILLAILADRAWRRLGRRHHVLEQDPATSIPKGMTIDTRPRAESAAASIAWTWVALAATGLALVISPVARLLHSANGNDEHSRLSRETPIAAIAWLREHPPIGLVYNTYEWGDYLLWAGPPGVEPFVTSHIHLVPPPVWRDFRAIGSGLANCLGRLDTYQVDTVVLDRRRQSRLMQRLDADCRWGREYSDVQSAIYRRKTASGTE